MERIEQNHIPQGARLTTTTPARSFVVKNIGTGPALNLSFDFVPTDPTKSKDAPNQYARRFPYVASRDDLEAPIGPELVSHQDYRFTAYYESLGHKRYFTEMVLRGRSVDTSVLLQDWIFKVLP